MSDGRPQHVKVTRRHVLARAVTLSLLGSAAIGALAPAVQEATGQTRAKSARTMQPPPALIVGEGIEKLPPAVVDMRAEILSAVESNAPPPSPWTTRQKISELSVPAAPQKNDERTKMPIDAVR